MAKTVFISIVHEDKLSVIDTLHNWLKQGFIKDIDFVFEDVDVRDKGEEEIKTYLKGLLDKSQVVVFIVGKDTHNHKWIEWEYSYAQTKPNTRLVYFYLKKYQGGAPAIFPKVSPYEFNVTNFKKYV